MHSKDTTRYTRPMAENKDNCNMLGCNVKQKVNVRVGACEHVWRGGDWVCKSGDWLAESVANCVTKGGPSLQAPVTRTTLGRELAWGSGSTKTKFISIWSETETRVPNWHLGQRCHTREGLRLRSSRACWQLTSMAR